VQGSIDSTDFLVFYIKGDRVQAVAGMNRDRELDVWEERFRLGNMPTPKELENELAATAAT